MLVADFKRFPPERPSILELVKKLNIISQMLTHKQFSGATFQAPRCRPSSCYCGDLNKRSLYFNCFKVALLGFVSSVCRWWKREKDEGGLWTSHCFGCSRSNEAKWEREREQMRRSWRNIWSAALSSALLIQLTVQLPKDRRRGRRAFPHDTLKVLGISRRFLCLWILTRWKRFHPDAFCSLFIINVYSVFSTFGETALKLFKLQGTQHL